MAYTPTNWECGDVVTAELLNKLEEAVENLSVIVDGMDGGDSKFVIGLDGSTNTLDKTWQEIYDAMNQGQSAVVRFSTPLGDNVAEYPVTNVVVSADSYSVTAITSQVGTASVRTLVFIASSANGYPEVGKLGIRFQS